jgi:plasmid maintenance system antidote protein VapI
MTDQPAEEQLRVEVRAALTQAKISQAEACRQLGVSTKHLNMMLKGHAPLTLGWAEQILGLCGKRIVINVRRQRSAPLVQCPAPENQP